LAGCPDVVASAAVNANGTRRFAEIRLPFSRLPIGFEYGDHVREVVDRTTSPKRFWTLQLPGPGKSLSRDCAVVARLHDNVTEEPVIILAGILGEGTEAASEVVSNQAYLDAVLQKAPKNWDQLNLEAVIEANVIEGHPGPPTVVAVETW
jgi:hypothetical protein